MSDEQKQPKLGEGHAMAMFRLGLKELGQALQALPDSNIRPMEEPGTVGNPTPQIVTKDMGYNRTSEDYIHRASFQPEQDQDRGMSR